MCNLCICKLTVKGYCLCARDAATDGDYFVENTEEKFWNSDVSVEGDGKLDLTKDNPLFDGPLFELKDAEMRINRFGTPDRKLFNR